MELPDWAKKLIEFLLKTSFKRVLSLMMGLGAGIIGLSWVDVVAAIIFGFLALVRWPGLDAPAAEAPFR